MTASMMACSNAGSFRGSLLVSNVDDSVSRLAFLAASLLQASATQLLPQVHATDAQALPAQAAVSDRLQLGPSI